MGIHCCPFCHFGRRKPSLLNEQSKIPTQEYIPLHPKVCLRITSTLSTLRLRIYTSVGVTSAIVFDRSLIVVVQAAKNKAYSVAFPICRCLPLAHRLRFGRCKNTNKIRYKPRFSAFSAKKSQNTWIVRK